jgi:NitT/TauT family transport system substrate-binding protein
MAFQIRAAVVRAVKPLAGRFDTDAKRQTGDRPMHFIQSRRDFLTSASLVAGAGVLGIRASIADEGPPETTTVRLPKYFPATCEIPMYLAENLLRAEGLTDVRFVEEQSDASLWIARGALDFDWNYAATHITSIEAGVPIVVLAGLHSGCLELVANDSVHGIAELREKRVGIDRLTSSPHVLVTLMAAYIGLDPTRDIEWVESGNETSMQLFIDGKIDAFLAQPPEPQELRDRHIGHTILATAVDQPWSEYYCCMLAGRAEYVRQYPVATKRVLRALLKAIDVCLSEPESAARRMIDRGFAASYDYALRTLSDARYDRWREFDPEDTLRFYALRMHEVGMIKSSPNKIITEAADWRFLNELKRELKA